MKTRSIPGGWARKGGLMLTPLALAILAWTGAMAAPGTLIPKQIHSSSTSCPIRWIPPLSGSRTPRGVIPTRSRSRSSTNPSGSAAAVPPALLYKRGYAKDTQPPTFPGQTFELNQGDTVTVTYVNDLVDALGNPLPNRMPVDTTLDSANPGVVGGLTPVPVVAHLHGGDSEYLSDGGPDDWGTPCASYLGLSSNAGANCTGAVDPQEGPLFSFPYTYKNQQEAGTLWYHDHALGITRTNVYMGLAGFYILRDPNEDALRTSGVLPSPPTRSRSSSRTASSTPPASSSTRSARPR